MLDVEVLLLVIPVLGTFVTRSISGVTIFFLAVGYFTALPLFLLLGSLRLFLSSNSSVVRFWSHWYFC